MIEVNVTYEHIAEGHAGNKCYCPIALALKGLFPPETHISVNSFHVEIGDHDIALPWRAQSFVRSFDEGNRNDYPVEAFKFQLEGVYL